MPIIPTLDQLKQEFGLKNVSIVNAKTAAGFAANKALTGIASAVQIKHGTKNNPYTSRIPVGPAHDIDNGDFLDPDFNLLGKSLGNPVYTSLTILGGKYTDKQGRAQTYKRIDLESILISVSFPRKIVKTEIQGRNGTVKEYIGEDDAQITIRGIICGSNGVYPTDEVSQLLTVIQAPVAVGIISEYLNPIGIVSLVFETREISQAEGGYSYQPFTLNAISDTAQELRITGN